MHEKVEKMECAILERIVYKHKNKHRRCIYFQYVLKVRRDLNLLESVNFEEILDASFLVINGNKPKQKVMLLESLMRRRCDGDKYNFLERLLGAARLLSQMVEPLLRAAMCPFPDFIGCACTHSSISSTSIIVCLTAHTPKLHILETSFCHIHRFNYRKYFGTFFTLMPFLFIIEVFQEYYPRKMEATVTLDCIWQIDKYVLVERADEREPKSQEKDGREDVLIQPSNIQYDNIEAFIGDESVLIDADLVSAEQLSSWKACSK